MEVHSFDPKSDSESASQRITRYIAIFSLVCQRWGNVIPILQLDIEGWVLRGEELLHELENNKPSADLNKRAALYLFDCFEFIPRISNRIKPYQGGYHGSEKDLYSIAKEGRGKLGKFYLDYNPYIYDDELRERLEDSFVDLYEITVRLSCGARYESVEHLKRNFVGEVLLFLIPKLHDHLSEFSEAGEQLSNIYAHFYRGFRE